MSQIVPIPQALGEMSVAARLVGFAVLLALIFGAAFLSRGALGPEPATDFTQGLAR